MSHWSFQHISHPVELAFNKVLEEFYKFGVAGLIRENIQNSLDAKLKECTEPVNVNIETGTIDVGHIPGFQEIKDRINSLEGGNSYTRETIEHMKSKVNSSTCNYISFEDSNTKGLSGAKEGQAPGSSWNSYAYSTGSHYEDTDEEVEKSRGGSHGIGKIASNSASDVYMMYFANCDEEGNKHLGGTVQLIDHSFEGKAYRSTGYFTQVREEKYYPFENSFHEVFKKDTRGLKIIVPFLREQFNNEDEILKSICDSFFIAILNKRLVVNINGKAIDHKTIGKYIKNKKYYEQKISEIKKEFTPLYLDTFANHYYKDISVKDRENDYIFSLYFRYDENISKGRMAIIRTVGMKIEDFTVKSNANKPFNAVLIAKSVEEDMFIKSLENESHTKIGSQHIKNQKHQKNATRFINNLHKEIAQIIDEHIRNNNPVDGTIDTSDIIYDVVNNFKKDLKQATETLKINEGGMEKTITKITEAKRKPKEKDGDKGKEKPKNDKPKKPREPRKRAPEPGDDTPKEIYTIDPSLVKRAIIGNNEYLNIDLTHFERIKTSKACNISMVVVDGMGNECSNEFNMNSNYSKAMDIRTKTSLQIKDNAIKNIKVGDRVFNFKLELKNNDSKKLKFIYILEV